MTAPPHLNSAIARPGQSCWFGSTSYRMRAALAVRDNVRFTPESGLVRRTSSCLLRAKSGKQAMADFKARLTISSAFKT
jgi:hypothetical protein